MVLAQLLLPSVFERARASQESHCVALGSTAGAGKAPKQSTHAHGQECAHCRPQAVVLSAPLPHPEIVDAPAFETAARHSEPTVLEVALQSLPPPTGPPNFSLSV
jgi:hypothetical protein